MKIRSFALFPVPVVVSCCVSKAMDYARIRSGELPPAKSVGVNHRALITRALTKYPVDYALFRELLQNSADAHASHATIKFEPVNPADSNLRSIHTLPISRLEFTNDGDDFTDDDWKRLREIASGNPNETKIGAFGVGFYSTFELSDNPLVHSGDSIMTFRFQGDELQYQQVHASRYVKGTVIDLPYRSPKKVPDLVKFTSFLSQSFTLVPLEEVDLFVGNIRLLRLQKLSSPPQPLSVDSYVSRSSPSGQLVLKKLVSTPLQITLQYVNATQMPPATMEKGFLNFGRQLVQSLATASQDPSEETTVVTFLRRIDAIVDVRVSSKFKQKMIESVLKAPPSQTTMSLLTQSRHEHEVSQLKPPLSEYIFPSNFNDAKIFVGFPTKQSTSIKSHLALNQIIPTLERTAIDMSNDLVKEWNCQILFMAGVLARCVYESEMRICHDSQEAGYILNRYQMGESSPDPVIGRWVASGFWRCSKVIYLPTAKDGIMPSDKVRWPGEAKDLIRNTPIILPQKGLETFYESLRKLGYVQEISSKELALDISQSPLDPIYFRHLVKWATKNEGYSVARQAIVTQNEEFWYLATVNSYQDETIVPEDCPLPNNCLPQHFLRACGSLAVSDLEKLGWHALTVVEWTQFLVDEASNPSQSVVTSENLTIRFLGILSGKWRTLKDPERAKIVQLLQSVSLIPTQLGMMRPQQSYIKEIPLCSHIPVISDKVTASKDFLREIGLRESMDMRYVLQNLHDSQLKWSSSDLIDYLVANATLLKSSDWITLQEGKFFQKMGTKELFRARDLYAPDDAMREMQFPVLDIPEMPSGTGLKILRRLGLKLYPTVEELSRRKPEKALNYFLKNFGEASYNPRMLQNHEIIPCEKGVLRRPEECFSDKRLKIFGLPVVDSKYTASCDRLGVRKRPPMPWLVKRVLSDPPKDWVTANEIFIYFSLNISDFSRADIALLRNSPFLPKGLRPSEVFMPDGESLSDIEALFPTIHPASAAMPFLQQVGVLQNPTLIQIVRKTTFEPDTVLQVLGGPARYVSLLARIQSEWREVSRDKQLLREMKEHKWLLGLRDDETSSFFYPTELSIVDDVILFDQFKASIVTSPQESLVEELYANLGVPRLSELLHQQVHIGRSVEVKNAGLEKHIKERLSLFLETTTKEKLLKSSDAGKLGVEFVDNIKLVRQLGKSPRVEVFTTSWIREPLTLLVTQKYQWIDISRALVKVCLRKPDPDAVIVLELQLSASLEALRLKGYNIKRSRDKQAPLDFKFTPTSASRSQYEPQKAAGNVNHNVGEKQVNSNPCESNSNAPLPGSLPYSPPVPQKPQPPPSHREEGKGLLGSLPHILSNGLTGSYQRLNQGIGTTEGYKGQTAAQPVNKSLEAGIRASRSHRNESLTAPRSLDSPAPRSLDQECQSTKIYDLRRETLLPGGPVIYVTKNREEPLTPFLMSTADSFRVILQKLQSIYRFPWDSIAVFVDNDTSTIAFNYNGSIFVNLMVFIQEFLNTSAWSPSSALDYWFVVIAHELAHNLVSAHGAKHSFFTEAYIQKFLAARRQHIIADSVAVNHA